MKTQAMTCALLLALGGCSSMSDDMTAEPSRTRTSSINVVEIGADPTQSATEISDMASSMREVDRFGALNSAPEYASARGMYKGQPLTKHVGDYVQNMTQDLISNMEYVTDKTPVGVTHFALLDSDLQQTNLLGHQMAESFVHEFHKFRIPVIDYKATQYIRVTPEGDFFLSRDFLELKNRVPLEYILTGTMTRHQGGYLVNARMLGLESKAVVASSQMLIPYYVVDALLPSEEAKMDDVRDGVRLIQGTGE